MVLSLLSGFQVTAIHLFKSRLTWSCEGRLRVFLLVSGYLVVAKVPTYLRMLNIVRIAASALRLPHLSPALSGTDKPDTESELNLTDMENWHHLDLSVLN